MQRQGVKEPLDRYQSHRHETPIGRGQRHFIGDRKTGKTAVCVDTILNQRRNWESGDPKPQMRWSTSPWGEGHHHCCREPRARRRRRVDCTTIVASPASDSAGFKWLAPYAGSAIAQHFMYDGKHALIVFDDLSKHADVYRAISLLLRRPLGARPPG